MKRAIILPHLIFFLICLLALASFTAGPVSLYANAPALHHGSIPSPTEPADEKGCLRIPKSECEALRDLFISTNGAMWLNNSGWFEPKTSPCIWYGITCTPEQNDGYQHVRGLSIPWNGLQGSLPASLMMLTWLNILDLSGNQLNGDIPPELGTLKQLTTLDLAENQLVGTVPVELNQLNNLSVLHLYENQLIGDLPIEFSELNKIRNFKFQNTHLCVPSDKLLTQWLTGIYNLTRVNSNDCQPLNDEGRPLVLIYAVLDNNLGDEWSRLINNAEKGMRDDAFDVAMLIDGPGLDNSYEYTLQEDYNDSCPSLATDNLDCSRYRVRRTLRQESEDTAQADTLASFITNAILEHPKASQVILSLVGHGAGWGANALPAQPPRGWKPQTGVVTDTLGGMLWDDNIGNNLANTRSLSTAALGQVLEQVKATTGRTIDLLYLDACSMAMTEVAYELRDYAKFLLASENTKWATFPYDELLPYVAENLDARTLGLRWLERETEILQRSPGHPYTFSLVDLSKMNEVMTTTTALAALLAKMTAAQITQIRQLEDQISHFDSNYTDGVDAKDAYIDLKDFARHIQQHFANQSDLQNHAQAVQDAVANAVVLQQSSAENASHLSAASLTWADLGGLSIYLPLVQDESRRSEQYNANNLAWAKDSQWDEWLRAYWQVVDGTTLVSLSTCQQTSKCPEINGWGFWEDTPTQIFVPVIRN